MGELIFGGADIRCEICVTKSIGLAYSWDANVLTIYYLHSQLQSPSQPQAFSRLLMLTKKLKNRAFWFAPMVTQIISDTKFNILHLSKPVYAWIEPMWTDSHNDYKDFDSR